MSLQEAQEASARQAASAGEGEAGPSTISPLPGGVPAAPGSSNGAAGLPVGLTAPLENSMTREPPAPGDSGVVPTPQSHPSHGSVPDNLIGEDEEDEEAMLARAMAMSRGEAGGDVEMDDEDEDEEAAIARAIQMSLQEPKNDGESKS